MFKPPMLEVPMIESLEFQLIKRIVSTITSFIINGDPNSDSNNQDFTFEPVSSGNPLESLDISNEAWKMIEFPEKERMKVWDEIFEEEKVPLY